MNGKDGNYGTMPDVLILERRTQRDAELSSADIMKILRKRAAKNAEKKSGTEAQWKECAER